MASPEILSAFFNLALTIRPNGKVALGGFDYTEGPSYQTVNCLQDARAQYSWWVQGARHGSTGTDRADLYRVRLDPATLRDPPVLEQPTLEQPTLERLGSVKIESTGRRAILWDST